MHGVISQALDQVQENDLRADLLKFCEVGSKPARYKPGNCAHALGHGLMLKSGHRVEESLSLCSQVFVDSLEYYCATGVFMEYADKLPAEATPLETMRTTGQVLCGNVRFPSACYRYMLRHIGMDLSPEQLIEMCLHLPDRTRLGCFHGLGAMYSRSVGEEPRLLSVLCTYGTLEDETVCIEGVIEKLAEHNEQLARKACETLNGKQAEVCFAAATEKMYRLDKPSMTLYVQ